MTRCITGECLPDLESGVTIQHVVAASRDGASQSLALNPNREKMLIVFTFYLAVADLVRAPFHVITTKHVNLMFIFELCTVVLTDRSGLVHRLGAMMMDSFYNPG